MQMDFTMWGKQSYLECNKRKKDEWANNSKQKYQEVIYYIPNISTMCLIYILAYYKYKNT